MRKLALLLLMVLLALLDASEIEKETGDTFKDELDDANIPDTKDQQDLKQADDLTGDQSSDLFMSDAAEFVDDSKDLEELSKEEDCDASDAANLENTNEQDPSASKRLESTDQEKLNEDGEDDGDDDVEGLLHLHHQHSLLSAHVALENITSEPKVAASTGLFAPKEDVQFSDVAATPPTIHSSRGAAMVTFAQEDLAVLFTAADTTTTILVSKDAVAEVSIIEFTTITRINAAMEYPSPSAIHVTDGQSVGGGCTVHGYTGAVPII